MDVHSKRAAEIEAEMQRTGHESYRARNIAARATRAPKRHQPVGDLMPRWVAEIGEVGWSVESLCQAIDREAAARRNAHELEVHGYTHVATTVLGPSTFAQGPGAPRRRGRRRKEEELNVI